MQPAFETQSKALLTQHIGQVSIRLQQNDSALATGATVWLSGQILCAYLGNLFARRHVGRSVLELGAGTGLCSIYLSKLGFNVVATDKASAIANIQNNIELNSATNVHVHTLDWLDQSTWSIGDQEPKLFDLIVASDVVYKPDAFQPFLDVLTFHSARAQPRIILALERRDSAAVDSFLHMAADSGYQLDRVKDVKVSKALRAADISWTREQWHGVEIYNMQKTS